jgi:hypothetical protein
VLQTVLQHKKGKRNTDIIHLLYHAIRTTPLPNIETSWGRAVLSSGKGRKLSQ